MSVIVIIYPLRGTNLYTVLVTNIKGTLLHSALLLASFFGEWKLNILKVGIVVLTRNTINTIMLLRKCTIDSK